jgi:hypothetical protein
MGYPILDEDGIMDVGGRSSYAIFVEDDNINHTNWIMFQGNSLEIMYYISTLSLLIVHVFNHFLSINSFILSYGVLINIL